MNKPTITIGIPAYNEEQNIGNLLKSLLSQKILSGELVEILVISDGSTDNTVTEVKSLNNNILRLIERNERKGKSERQNEICKMVTSDILIIVDSDILLNNNSFIEKLIKPLLEDISVGMTAPLTIPAQPTNLFEKILAHGHKIKQSWFLNINNGDNLYMCWGAARALRYNFYKKIEWPQDFPEDAFSYLACIKQGFKFKLVTDTFIIFHTSSNFYDYINQSGRFFGGRNKARKKTPQIDKEYLIPLHIKVAHTWQYLLKNPILTILYILVSGSAWIGSTKNYKSIWLISPSTKVGFNNNRDKKKLVCFDMDNLNNPHWAGGQAVVTKNLAPLWSKYYDITVFCSKYPRYKDYEENGVAYKHIGLGTNYSKLNNLAYIVACWIKASRVKADLILEDMTAPFSVMFLPLFTKIPVIARGSFFSADKLSKKYKLPFFIFENLGFKLYKNFIALNEGDYKKGLELNKNIRATLIYNGVGSEYFSITPKEEEDYIFFIGRLDVNHKGLDLLFKAYSKITERINTQLIIAGNGTDSNINFLKTLSKELKLEERVKFLGRVEGENKIKYLSAAKCIVFPSRYEGHSLSSLEAAAIGKPMLCFDIPGFKSFRSKDVLKARPFDIDDFSKKLYQICNDAELRRVLSHNVKAAAKDFTWDNTANKYLDFFNSIL